MQSIIFYTSIGGPNPPKVAIIFEELGLPSEKIIVRDPKEDWYVKINPNGRLPAITDPNNNDLTIWESGAIVEYLVDTYDKDNKLKPTDIAGKWHAKQYLHFQMSGQGPYFGQAVWFSKFHQEDLTSAKERYIQQTIRVFEVLDNILQDKQYLVQDKVTYADLAFVPWSRALIDGNGLDGINEAYQLREKLPNFFAWHERLLSRPAVQKAVAGQKTFGSGLAVGGAALR